MLNRKFYFVVFLFMSLAFVPFTAAYPYGAKDCDNYVCGPQQPLSNGAWVSKTDSTISYEDTFPGGVDTPFPEDIGDPLPVTYSPGPGGIIHESEDDPYPGCISLKNWFSNDCYYGPPQRQEQPGSQANHGDLVPLVTGDPENQPFFSDGGCNNVQYDIDTQTGEMIPRAGEYYGTTSLECSGTDEDTEHSKMIWNGYHAASAPAPPIPGGISEGTPPNRVSFVQIDDEGFRRPTLPKTPKGFPKGFGEYHRTLENCNHLESRMERSRRTKRNRAIDQHEKEIEDAIKNREAEEYHEHDIDNCNHLEDEIERARRYKEDREKSDYERRVDEFLKDRAEMDKEQKRFEREIERSDGNFNFA